MLAARASCFALADALEKYVLAGCSAWRGFHEACAAADAYLLAIQAARPYHFGAIPVYNSADVINLEGVELLAIVRELRGTALSLVVKSENRCLVAYRFADDGIAGYFDVELRSMRRFGVPRRMPAAA